MDWYRTWCQWWLCSLSFLKKKYLSIRRKKFGLKRGWIMVWESQFHRTRDVVTLAPMSKSSRDSSSPFRCCELKYFQILSSKNIRGNCFRGREKWCSSYWLQPLQPKEKKKENTKQVRSWWRNSEIAELWNPGGRLQTQCTEQTQTPTSKWKIRPYHLKVNKSIIPPFQKQI